MPDVEKELSTDGVLYRDRSNTQEDSPVSDSSSHDAEKEQDLEKNQQDKAAAQPDGGQDPTSSSASKTMLVDWNGPDDPEFPQNL